MKSTEVVQRRLRIAARALGRHGLAHAYGHVSERLGARSLLVCASRPMALIGPADDGHEVPIEGALPDGVLGEVRLHQQIYRARPDVNAVVRCMPPALMALGSARLVPAPRHGFGAYFSGGVALWDDPQLIRDDARALALAQTLGARSALVMRGNGLVVAAPSLLKAVVLAWYLEDAARLELAVRSAGLLTESVVLSQEECEARATDSGAIFERMGQYLSAGDPEGRLDAGGDASGDPSGPQAGKWPAKAPIAKMVLFTQAVTFHASFSKRHYPTRGDLYEHR